MSVFCPNLSDPIVKSQFEELSTTYGEDVAYFLWDKHQGDIDAINKELTQRINIFEESEETDFTKYDTGLGNKIQRILQDKYPEIKLDVSNNPQWAEQNDNIYNQKEDLKDKVKYVLKSVNILTDFTPKQQQEWNKFKKGNITPEQLVEKLQIPKEQKQIVIDTINKLGEDITPDQVALDIASNYSYVVEVNIAGNVQGDLKYSEFAENTGLFTEEELSEEGKFVPTQHYVHLTVPGGTNYTENEISTPLIKPSIKGHAAFSTDQGVGWFRSDDEGVKVGEKTVNKSDLPIGIDDKFEQEDVFDSTKTRRVLEFQSDLFQKGRGKEDLAVTKESRRESRIEGEPGIPFEAVGKTEIFGKTDIQGNQFLQLLNKSNNWVTFFVKSIVQDSAKKGYESVLFPTGETAAKVEGHETIVDEIEKINKEIEVLKDLIINPDKALEEDVETDEETGKFISTKFYSHGAYSHTEKEGFIEYLKDDLSDIEKRKQEFKTQGIEKLKPIEAFYEIRIGKILEKTYGKENIKVTTDDHGNEWRKLLINQARDLDNILLQRDEADRITGQANIKAMSVLIDAKNQNQDTLPHEYAHHYIAWFRGTPIVQEGIKRFGSEEKLVQAIGEQVVKQKGEAYNWWNKFVNWILNLLSDNQVLQVLTDSFINRTNLAKDFTYIDQKVQDDIGKYGLRKISNINNSYVWGIEKEFNLINRWTTEPDGTRKKHYENFTKTKANNIAKKIREKGFKARLVQVQYKPNENLTRYRIEVSKDIGLPEGTSEIRSDSNIDNDEFNDNVFLAREAFTFIRESKPDGLSFLNWLKNASAKYNNIPIFKDTDFKSLHSLIDKKRSELKNIPVTVFSYEEFKKYSEEVDTSVSADRTLMAYNPETGIVINAHRYVKEDRTNSEFALHLTHEILHGFTNKALEEPRTASELKFNADIVKLYNDSNKQVNANIKPEDRSYGWTNEKEFVSETMTNPDFVEELKSIKVGKLNAFQRFINALWEFFTGNKVYDNTVYAKAYKAITSFIEEGVQFNDTYFNRKGYRTYQKQIDKDVKKNVYGVEPGNQDSVAQGVKDIGKDFKYNKETNTFTHIPTRSAFTSVNDLMREFGKTSRPNPQGKWDKVNLAIRRKIEENIEETTIGILSETGVTLTTDAKEKLNKILEEYKGEEIVTLSNVIVADPEKKLVDTVDLVIVDKKGRIKLHDFQVSPYYNGFLKFDTFRKGNVTAKRSVHVKLSIDKHMIEKALNVPVFNMIVPLLNVDLDYITDEKSTINDVQVSREYDDRGYIVFDTIEESVPRIYGENPINFKEKGFDQELRQERDLYGQEEYTDSSKEDILDEKVYQEKSNVLNELLENIKEHAGRRLELMQKRYSFSRFRSQEEFYDELMKKESTIEAIIEIVKYSSQNINRVYKEYQERKDEKRDFDKEDIRLLAKWKDAILAYEDLDRLMEEILKDESLFKDPSIITLLKDAVGKKNLLKNLYKTEGKYLLAKWLTPYYDGIRTAYKERIAGEYRVEAKRLRKTEGKSREQVIEELGTQDEYVDKAFAVQGRTLNQQTRNKLEQELSVASRDIGQMARWLDNVLDTADPVAAAMVNAFVEADRKSYLESVDKQIDILNRLRKLEKFRKKRKFSSSEDFYSFMLEFLNGKPTGYLLKPWRSKLREKERELREEWSKEFTYKEVNSKLKKWRDRNAPVDHDAYNDAFEEFLNDRMNAHEITPDEYKELMKTITTWNVSITDMVKNELISEEAGEMAINWKGDNRWFFVKLSNRWYDPGWKSFMDEVGVSNDLSLWKQHQELKKSTHPFAEFYTFIEDISAEANAKLPYSYRLGYRLPGVAKILSERAKDIMKGKHDPSKQAAQTFKASFIVRPEDTERGSGEYIDELGNVKYFLPIHYTAQMEPANQSYDIAGIYYRFWDSANEYANKREILAEMEMTKFFIENRRAKKRNVFNEIIKKARPTGNVDDEKVDERTEYIESTQLAEQFGDWFEMAVYGKRSKPGTLIPLGKNTVLDVSKLVDSLNSFTSVNLLGFNMVQGVANVLIGETMQAIDSFAGEYVNPKNLTKGTLTYTKWLPGMMGDVGRRNPQNIGSLLIREFNILHGDPVHVIMSKSSRVGQLASYGSFYFTQQAGEHWMQSRFLFALLDKKRAYDKEGNDLGSMLKQYYAKDGKLMLNSKVDPVKSKWTRKDQDMFMRKTKGILSRMHGEYSDLGRVAIQRLALGRMAYMFRKFVVPGIKRRYGKRKYIQRLDQYVEGNYITTTRFARQLAKDLWGFKLALMSEDWTKLTNHEKANIKRTIGEITFILGATILASLLYNIDGDDDKPEAWMYNYWSYQMYRLQTELLMFSPKIDEAMTILRSPMASMSIMENIIHLTSQMFDPFELYERGPWKGQPKIKKTTINFVPVYKQFYKARDIEQQIEWFR